MTNEQTVANAILELVNEAMREDAREGSRFDAEGFSNFFPEEESLIVGAAWEVYNANHDRRSA
jgi:hypothetical protein